MPEIPKYFLADIANEVAMTPALISEACETLRHNRVRFLKSRKTPWMAELIASLAEDWLDPSFPLRNETLREGPSRTGIHPDLFEQGLDRFWESVSIEKLRSFLTAELGDPESLDQFRTIGAGRGDFAGTGRMGVSPDLIYYYNLDYNPSMALSRMAHALLMRSALFLRTLPGQAWLPLKFAHSIYEREPKIASCIEVAEWNLKTPLAQEMESRLVHEAEVIWALGHEKKAREIHASLGYGKRFLSWTQPISFAWIQKEALDGFELKQTLKDLTSDLVAWNQFGPFAPDVVYVETRGAITPEEFAVKLAEALGKEEGRRPRGELSSFHEKQIETRRSFYRIRCERLSDAKMFESPETTHWTVILEEDLQLQSSCGGRFVYVKPVSDFEEVLRICEPRREEIGVIGIAAAQENQSIIARRLAQWGAPRICQLGRMQDPPIGAMLGPWTSISSSLRWTEWES